MPRKGVVRRPPAPATLTVHRFLLEERGHGGGRAAAATSVEWSGAAGLLPASQVTRKRLRRTETRLSRWGEAEAAGEGRSWPGLEAAPSSRRPARFGARLAPPLDSADEERPTRGVEGSAAPSARLKR